MPLNIKDNLLFDYGVEAADSRIQIDGSRCYAMTGFGLKSTYKQNENAVSLTRRKNVAFDFDDTNPYTVIKPIESVSTNTESFATRQKNILNKLSFDQEKQNAS